MNNNSGNSLTLNFKKWWRHVQDNNRVYFQPKGCEYYKFLESITSGIWLKSSVTCNAKFLGLLALASSSSHQAPRLSFCSAVFSRRAPTNWTPRNERKNEWMNEWMNENFINVSMYLAKKQKKLANWGHLTKVNTY